MKILFSTKQKKIRGNGFTVLEAIVAIMILSLAVSGAFSSVRQSLSQSILAKDEVKAFYLAQEGVEVVRNMRDNNQIKKLVNESTINWLAGISENNSDPCYYGQICRVDPTSTTDRFVRCSIAGCPNLNLDTSTQIMSYGAGNPTNFNRQISLEYINNDQVAVVVRVAWTKGIINREFRAKTLLFNWVVTP